MINILRKQWLVYGLFIPLMLMFNGCVFLVAGSIGVVGGYVVSPDTIEGVSDYDVVDVWDAAKEEIGLVGIVLEEDEDLGIMTAKVHGSKVTVTIFETEDNKTRLTVKARRWTLPRIRLAQDIFMKIMENLDQ